MSENMKPQSRVEQILDAMLNGGEIPAPQSRVEAYLAALYHNRLCYTEPGADIEWDGNTNGKYYLYDPVDKLGFVKVSDLIPPVDALNNSIMTIVRNGVATEETASVWTAQSITDMTVVTTEKQDALVLVIRKSGASVDTTFVFEETGVYFQTDALTNKYVSKLHIDEIVHRIPAKYAPEIPFFDLVEMGLPAIVPDVTGTGYVSYVNDFDTDFDFSEFEKALQNGLIRVRVMMQLGEQAGPVSAVCTPIYIGTEEHGYWSFTVIAASIDSGQTMRTTFELNRFTSSLDNNEKVHMGLKAHCGLLQPLVM